jgi:peptidoglycan/xylan/chitin deacetylase (PgdA/CDA1 family)
MVPGSRRDLPSRASRALAYFLPTKTVRMHNRRPIVSFTFDDIDDSAVANGARILESHGLHGTFYVAGALCGTRYEHWQFANADRLIALLERGHELGCHTYSHPDIQTLGRGEIGDELGANRAFFAAIDSRIRLENFAYPYGSAGLPQKRFVQERFLSCRGVRAGINAGRVDLGQLRATQLYDVTLDAHGIDSLIDDVCRQNGWLIFYTHDVMDSPTEHGCSPALLDYAAQAAKRAQCACLTVRDALTEIGYASERRPKELAQRAGAGSERH